MPPLVYIATPSHDHKFHAGYALSLIGLFAARQYSFQLSKVGGAGVARARNNMAQEFLASKADVYFAIDADISFEPAAVKRCVDAAIERQTIVCGLYALKQEKLAWCVNQIPGEEMDPATGLQKVACSGTGFMCVPRVVFERMIEAHPEIAYAEDLPDEHGKTRWDFFSMGVVNGRYLTEDWFFCHRARALGFDVFADLSVILRHEGMISFPLPAEDKADQLRDEIDDLNSRLAALSQWPADYGVAPDHCADVLAGSYDVPFDPPMPPKILDLGANVGAFAKWAARRWPGCELVCYEPNPKNNELARRTMIRERLARFPVHNSAVTDRDGKGFLRDSVTNCGAHSLFETGEVGETGIEVTTIDAAHLPPADILKIDTEGAELIILNRLAEVARIREFCAIMLEYHCDDDATAIRSLLEKHGFECVGEKFRCKDRGELKFLRRP